jgi:1,4-dihydroxy-2-naphthoate octaprenyltransferase
MMLERVRFRFLMYAGLLPYLLGSAIAFRALGSIDLFRFWLGLAGISAALLAVQVLNENFDLAYGSNGIFSPKRLPPLLPLKAGVLACIIALGIGVYLAAAYGWPLLGFVAFGAFAIIFYLGPPIRFCYRGLGELFIFLAYGPAMTLGAYYLQTQAMAMAPLSASLVLGCLVFALAVVNEIPDYHADRLVGKLNLVVRLGRRRAAILYAGALSVVFVLLALNVCLGFTPVSSLVAFVALPLASWSICVALRETRARKLVLAIRGTAALYLTVACLLIASYLA